MIVCTSVLWSSFCCYTAAIYGKYLTAVDVVLEVQVINYPSIYNVQHRIPIVWMKLSTTKPFGSMKHSCKFSYIAGIKGCDWMRTNNIALLLVRTQLLILELRFEMIFLRSNDASLSLMLLLCLIRVRIPCCLWRNAWFVRCTPRTPSLLECCSLTGRKNICNHW